MARSSYLLNSLSSRRKQTLSSRTSPVDCFHRQPADSVCSLVNRHSRTDTSEHKRTHTIQQSVAIACFALPNINESVWVPPDTSTDTSPNLPVYSESLGSSWSSEFSGKSSAFFEIQSLNPLELHMDPLWILYGSSSSNLLPVPLNLMDVHSHRIFRIVFSNLMGISNFLVVSNLLVIF